jgi:hypothetical protein
MTSNVTLKGNIVIGSSTDPKNAIKIPLDSIMPPPSGHIVFNYQLKDGTDPDAVVSVGDFLTWAQKMLSIPDFQSDLPASLVALSIGVDKLNIDTSGQFDINVLFGTLKDKKWSPDWKPIEALPFTFNDLELDVAYAA